MKDIVIVWFRQDLRIHDNPALYEACRRGQVIPVYILDDHTAGDWQMGGASRWWLHHSLIALNKSLGGNLRLFKGDPHAALTQLSQETSASAVYWNRAYEPWRIKRDSNIKLEMQKQGYTVQSFNGSLLWEPWDITKQDGTHYKVFTPFYRKGCLNAHAPREPLPPIELDAIAPSSTPFDIDNLQLLPKLDWDSEFYQHWQPGETGAADTLSSFLNTGLAHYRHGRNYPSKPYISTLSPHLHFGEISPNQVWYASAHAALNTSSEDALDCFHSELGWREFSYYQLYYNPDLPEKNLQIKFDRFPWKTDSSSHLIAWQKGLTGYPIIDAGMRQLWKTGYMHNRVRMVVGSFLVKNLLLHWQHGARWFWDCLLDADLASNSASWQWVAGCGADAAPYFRIFNPVTQGEKFDSDGDYIRQYIPELSNIPNKYIHTPWELSTEELLQYGVVLGETYPAPIVDLKHSRNAALEALSSIKEA